MNSGGIVNRREFLCKCGACGLGLACAAFWPGMATAQRPAGSARRKDVVFRDALFWEPAGEGRVRCMTCPNQCVVAEGGVTRCRTRVNRGGRLQTGTYGQPCVLQPDPLEKNPLHHVMPGSEAVVVATAGCNLTCTYCQNWEISQVGPERTRNMDVSPEALVGQVQKRKIQWLTFSYTEPVAYYEYALDSARLARERGVRVAMVTAGVIQPKPLEQLMAVSDAFSVTLKGATPEFYRDVCGANLDDVWRTLQALVKAGKWVEVVTLLVPGLNDDENGIRRMAGNLARLKPDIPWHLLRFFPAYKLRNVPQTPLETLEKARGLALKAGLRFVYLSNLPGHAAANTTCSRCGKTLVERVGFKVTRNDLAAGACPHCGQAIPGVWS